MDLVHRIAVGLVVPLPVEQLVEAAQQVVEVDGLAEVVVRAELVGGTARVQRGVGSHDEDPNRKPATADLRDQVAAIDARHLQVGDQHRRGEVLQHCEGLDAVGGDLNVEALVAQELAEAQAGRRVVLGDEDAYGLGV